MRNETDLNEVFGGVESGQPNYDRPPQPSDFIEDMQGEGYDDLSDKEKIELLEALIIIMKSFTDLGFGLDPVNKLIEEFEKSHTGVIDLVDYEDVTDEE